MDRPALIRILDDFIDAYNGWTSARRAERWDVAEDDLTHMLEWYPLVVTIAERHAPRVAFGAMADVAESIADPDWWRANTMALATRGVIERGEELEAALGPEVETPRLDAAALHPTVWDAAKSLWRSEHYRQAVDAAAVAVNAHLQQRLGRRDASNTALVREAFTRDPPSSNRSRLRLWPDDGSDTYKNLHDGARDFGAGCFTAIRNVGSHEQLEELDPQVALEQLAAFSILARWIDEAKLLAAATTADPATPPE